ncbi:hypothetical protein LINPERPRIM_LOCUS717 [Linum perenne]
MTPATRIIVLFPPPLILPLCIEEAGVEGDHIVQPINHKFDHSLLIRMFIVLCDLIHICSLLMTNEARELGVPVWFMCMKK